MSKSAKTKGNARPAARGAKRSRHQGWMVSLLTVMVLGVGGFWWSRDQQADASTVVAANATSGNAPGASRDAGSAGPVPAVFAPSIPNKARPSDLTPEGMVWVPGGEFSMGCQAASEGFCTRATLSTTNDAQPIHRVAVNGFWMDVTDVTNEKFEEFVKATGYVTIAERTPTEEEFPTAPPENLVAGSVVFTPTAA